jgi:hypothetical protein
MKINLFILCIFFSTVAIGQVDSTVYDQSNYLKDNFGIRHFSTLILKDDHSFIYHHLEGSCLFWFDKKGVWNISGDTLTLSEQVLCEHVITKRKESCKVLIRYLIAEEGLIYIEYDLNVEHFKPAESIISSDFKIRRTAANK